MGQSEDIVARAHARLDPGWLFLVAGLTIIGATVLIPAQDDLAEARLQRDRALAFEVRSAQRLEKYSDYLDALSQRNETLVTSLVATQLNLSPAGKRVLPLDGETAVFDASIFRHLEPPPTPMPELKLADTALRRLATDRRSRLWLIAGGAMCLLIGLMPAATRVRGGARPLRGESAVAQA